MTLIFMIVLAILVYYFFINKQANQDVFNGGKEKKCPNCSNPVQPDYNVCPVCKETLRKKCNTCNTMVDITWKYCPYCESTLKEQNI